MTDCEDSDDEQSRRVIDYRFADIGRVLTNVHGRLSGRTITSTNNADSGILDQFAE